MFRFKTVSSLLFLTAAILVCCVFILHFLTPTYESFENIVHESNENVSGVKFLPSGEAHGSRANLLTPANESNQNIIEPSIKCHDYSIPIEKYRSQPIVRGVIVSFPSLKSDYYFVQFRWFYRSWIESEMFTLDHWRTDIIILIADQFPSRTRKVLEHLDCRVENQRTSRRQISRCILVNHKLFSQRSRSQRQLYIGKYPLLNPANKLHPNIDRLFAIYDYTNRNEANMYDLLMVTTMNTFLTTQFGKYIPIKCSFLIGTTPDYSTWYGKTDQIKQFAHTLLSTLKQSDGTRKNVTIDFPSAIEKLKSTFSFIEGQVDVSCDSKITTYRTSVYHLKCYAHSTSLFSERMFRENAYDGYEKEPFNIYIAREYATLMALQSKVMTLDGLHSLAINVTRRAVFT
ncbi:unnamed protein product [Rotaria socialis]|uniref:DUF7164 domain-containing protein n=1 Tax=Rotaria socialis TaxID=392032 RepID=A0A817LFL9_9BILA|nr:unnamed protein product [Rotaria socialis]CAF3244948.1 unnamed protein product [Rotaria socialis]CAF3425064.1 unnamed protein product [Rotaria socialis]CAF3761060.1 unnamed protein product [Rotaria socialis]CAF4105013.1 unnamed protein product [Rotaria socialis]